ncbi:hypothetical protein HK104_008540 [Borealophlyctis nickersoniae]|nr:hypothetical protein HK104_008540 [Borealophlyctis nickersoniae]
MEEHEEDGVRTKRRRVSEGEMRNLVNTTVMSQENGIEDAMAQATGYSLRTRRKSELRDEIPMSNGDRSATNRGSSSRRRPIINRAKSADASTRVTNSNYRPSRPARGAQTSVKRRSPPKDFTDLPQRPRRLASGHVSYREPSSGFDDDDEDTVEVSRGGATRDLMEAEAGEGMAVRRSSRNAKMNPPGPTTPERVAAVSQNLFTPGSKMRTTRNSQSTLAASEVVMDASLSQNYHSEHDGDDEHEADQEPLTPIARRTRQSERQSELQLMPGEGSAGRSKRQRDADDDQYTDQASAERPNKLLRSSRRSGGAYARGSDTLPESPNTRNLRKRKADIDYDDHRFFKALEDLSDGPAYNGKGKESRLSEHFGAPSRSVPRAPYGATGGRRSKGYESDDEEVYPLISHSRAAALLCDLPKDLREEVEEKLRTHVENKDFADVDPLVIPKVDFSAIGGHESHIMELHEMIRIPLLYPELLDGRIDPPKGVLFYGPPGNGKTMMARAIAASCSTAERPVQFFMRKGADVLSKWVGESERQLRLLFEQAKAAQPSIIFFDEIDGLAPVRSSKQDQIHSSIVTTLLALMDGLEDRGQVIVIGATNRPDSVDPALLRPGRFDRMLEFRPPDEVARKTIIDVATKGWSIDEQLKSRVAKETRGHNGAQVKFICTEAYFHSIRRTYPQIYGNEHKLLVDPGSIKVIDEDFNAAMRKTVTHSTVEYGIPLPAHLLPLLSSSMAQIDHFVDRVQGFMRRRAGGQSRKEQCEPRLLVAGPPRMGQMQLGKALVNRLVESGFHVETLQSVSNGDGLEETIPEVAIRRTILRLNHAKLAALYIPDISAWLASYPDGLTSLENALRGEAYKTVLVIATCEGEVGREVETFIKGEEGNIDWRLGYRRVVRCDEPDEEKRRIFLADLIRSVEKPHPPRRAAAIRELPRAPLPPPREFTDAERRAINARCDRLQLDLTQRLRSFHKALTRNGQRFKPFAVPVDPEQFPEYYEVIRNPIDLSMMQNGINEHRYQTPEEWLDDIHLLVQNATEFNGRRSDIANKAFELRDEATQYVDSLSSTIRLNFLLASLWRQHEAKLSAPEKSTGIVDGNLAGASDRPMTRAERAARRMALKSAAMSSSEQVIPDNVVMEEEGYNGGPSKNAEDAQTPAQGDSSHSDHSEASTAVPNGLLVADSTMGSMLEDVEGGQGTAEVEVPDLRPASEDGKNAIEVIAVEPATLMAFTRRLIDATAGMSVRDLDVVLGVLMDIVEEVKEECDRTKVIEALSRELEIIQNGGA